MKGNIPKMNALLDMVTGHYTEQVTWREATTGRMLAESDFFEPLTVNSLIVPGYGGRMYYPTNTGFMILQARPATQSYLLRSHLQGSSHARVDRSHVTHAVIPTVTALTIRHFKNKQGPDGDELAPNIPP